MRRSIFCLSLAVLATLLVASPASAGRRWCARDPIVALNGNVVQVWVAIPEEYVSLVNGPIDVQFETPAGMTRTVVLTDGGYNGHGEVISFSDDAHSTIDSNGDFRVRIWVAVPIDERQADTSRTARKFPLQITVIDDSETRVLHGWNTGSWSTTRINDGASRT